MKILKKDEVRCLEESCKKTEQLTDIQLISEAANAFVSQFVDIVSDTNSTVLILCGNGKNGADGLEAANILSRLGYNVEAGIVFLAPAGSGAFEEKLSMLYSSVPRFTLDIQDLPHFVLPYHDVLIDALVGSGFNRPFSTEVQVFIDQINSYDSLKIAVDIASGLYCDGQQPEKVICCNYTVAVGTAKPAYFLSDKEDYVGQLLFAPIRSFDPYLAKAQSDWHWIDPEMVTEKLHPYSRIAHKYNHGSTLIVGGSYGMAGCMKLSGEASLRSGAGLVHLHVPYSAVDFLQSSLPEAIIHIDDYKYHLGPFELNKKFTSIAIGPGMGCKTKQIEMFEALLDQNTGIPMVIDADALTILSMCSGWRQKIKCPAILTPHKGEFERLFGHFDDQLGRIEAMLEYSGETGNTVLLKGADTVISTGDGTLYFSNTGNSGMATAGSGDVLTGILAGILAQGYSIEDAAIIGSQLHGTAGNIAAEEKGKRSLIAGDIVGNIGLAYQYLENGARE